MSGRVFLCMTGVFLVMCGGCRSSRQLYREGSFLYRDSMHCEQQENVDLRLLKLSALQTGVTIRKVELSAPDSLCRQFVRSVVWIEKQEVAEEKELVQVSGQITTEVFSMQEEEKKERMEVSHRTTFPGKRLVWLAGCFLFLLLIFKFRKVWF